MRCDIVHHVNADVDPAEACMLYRVAVLVDSNIISMVGACRGQWEALAWEECKGVAWEVLGECRGVVLADFNYTFMSNLKMICAMQRNTMEHSWHESRVSSPYDNFYVTNHFLS